MSDAKPKSDASRDRSPRYTVRLPGFLPEKATGLGDLIKQVTYSVAIKTCSGCQQRAAALNRWVVFAPKR